MKGPKLRRPCGAFIALRGHILTHETALWRNCVAWGDVV
jgi:hypothetical protein